MQSVCSAFYGGLFPEPGSSLPAVLKGCKGQYGASDSALKYVFLFKERATDDSNVSFEQCRVVLVVCRISDHKCIHGNVYTA